MDVMKTNAKVICFRTKSITGNIIKEIGQNERFMSYECMGFICYEMIVEIGKSAANNKFEIKCGYVREERLVLSNPHSS